MTGGSPGPGQAAVRPPRAPMQRRNRKRWAVAAGVAACWLALLAGTGSVTAATVLMVLLAVTGGLAVLGLRALGVSRDHPWVRRLAERPWRDGQDVLQLALRHLSDVFIVAPSGAMFAPDIVELRMNPGDVSSLSQRMDLELVAATATEAYESLAAARGARFPGRTRSEVRVVADPSVPAGRYRIAQGLPVDAGPGHDSNAGMYAVPPFAIGPTNPAVNGPYPGFVGHDGSTRVNPETGQAPPAPGLAGQAAAAGQASATAVTMVREGTAVEPTTVREQSRSPVPVLRLVTGDSMAETRASGARAGRGAVELGLPSVPTVSREHARFTFCDGQWWISNLGRNGLTLNGVPLVGEQPLSDGDAIRWGMRPGALLSRVQIG
jgi:hypothetical protein